MARKSFSSQKHGPTSSSDLTHSDRPPDAAKRSQPLTTAAALNGPRILLQAFRDHNRWRYFCEGQNTERPIFESRKNLRATCTRFARIRSYKPFYGDQPPSRDIHPIETANPARFSHLRQHSFGGTATPTQKSRPSDPSEMLSTGFVQIRAARSGTYIRPPGLRHIATHSLSPIR
jgi:hypothetical protein